MVGIYLKKLALKIDLDLPEEVSCKDLVWIYLVM